MTLKVIPTCPECGHPIEGSNLDDYVVRFYVSAEMPIPGSWDYETRTYVRPEGTERRTIAQFFDSEEAAQAYIDGRPTGDPFMDRVRFDEDGRALQDDTKPIGTNHLIHYSTHRKRDRRAE